MQMRLYWYIGMSNILQYSPGQLVTIIFETLNDVGARSDGYGIPVIYRIIFPNLSLASGYPQNMNRLDIGLFTFQFTLPINAASVGSYIVDIAYLNPNNGNPESTFFQVIVSAPGGQYSISTI